MSSQGAKKKRLGSRRRPANQNEMSKADELHVSDNDSVAQQHIPEENTESLNVLANPGYSQSETQNPPSPEFTGNRRKLGSSRRNRRGQHVKDSATELCHSHEEEVEEKTRGKQTSMTTQMSLAIQPERQEEFSQESEPDTSAIHHGFSAMIPDNSSETQNSTTTNCTETDLKSLIPKSETRQADLDENETNSKWVSDICEFVKTMQEGVDTYDTPYSEEVEESAHLVGNSKFTGLNVLSSPTVDQQLIDQSYSMEKLEEKLPYVYSVDKESKKRDDYTEMFRQDGNLQGNDLVNESHVESVVMQFSSTPEITTEKNSPQQNTEIVCSVGQVTISSPKEKLQTEAKQNEHLNLSEVKGAHQTEDVVCSVHEQQIKSTEMAHIDYTSENDFSQTNYLVSESHVKSDDVESSVTTEMTTYKHNPREHTEPEYSVDQATFSSSNEIFNVSVVKGADQPEDAVTEVPEQEVKLAEIQEMPQSYNSSENVILDATEHFEIMSGNLIDQTEVTDSYRSELTVDSADDSPTNRDLLNPDDQKDEHPLEDSNFKALQQDNEDHHVYDTKEPPISSIERVDTALGQVYEIEGRVEDDLKPSAEQTDHQEEEGLSEMEESESSLQTMQSEINDPYDCQPQQNNNGFSVFGNRRKLGSSRRNKGRQLAKDSFAEYPEPTEDVVKNTRNNETLETTEKSLTTETVLQEKTMETMLEEMDKFDTGQADNVSDQMKENAQVGTLVDTDLPSSSTVNQQMINQSNSPEAPSEELAIVCTVTETESKERDDETELIRQWGILQTNYLVSESHVKSDDVEFSVTTEMTTYKHNPREHTEPEYSVDQATFSSSNEIFNVSVVKGADQPEDAVTEVPEQEVKLAEIQEMPQSYNSSENVILDATEHFEIMSGNLIDQTEVTDSYRSELTVDSADDSPTNRDLLNPDDQKDEHPLEDSNFKALQQDNEDHHVYDTKEPPISSIERVDTALGQVYEIEGRVEDDLKPSAEQTDHQEEEGLSEMEESESSLQTMQSEINDPYDCQPQQNNNGFSVFGNRRKLGSSRRNKGRQLAKDSFAEYPEPTEDVVKNTRNNETLETTEKSLTTETVLQEKTMETMLEEMDKFDTAQADNVSDQMKENAQVGTLVDTDLPSSSTVDQQMINQSNSPEAPSEELAIVCTVTETESKERDDETELIRQWGILQTNYLVSESHVKSDDVEFSVTTEMTTYKHNPREHSEPEYSVDQATFSSSNEIFNVSVVKGADQPEDAVTEVPEQEVKPAEMQEMPQMCNSSDIVIHDATEHFEIMSGNLIDQAEVNDTYQLMDSAGDSPTIQKISNPDDQQDEHLTKESNFEALQQDNEDTKKPPISDIETVDSVLGQVYEIEGREEDDVKISAEQTGHQEREGFSEMEESESSLQTPQSEISVPFNSQPQDNSAGIEEQTRSSFNPIGNRRKLGSSRRNKGRPQVKDSVAESYHEHKEDLESIRDDEALETAHMLLATERMNHEELSQESEHDIMPVTPDISLYSASMPGYSFEVQSPTTTSYPEADLLITESDNLQEDCDEIETDFKVEVSDTEETPISDIERVDTALGQMYEIEGQVEDDVKPSAKQTGHREREGLSEMEENELFLHLQSEKNAAFDSQPQQNDNGFKPIGNRRKLGSSRRNRGRGHVKDDPTEEVVTRENEPYEETEKSLTRETTVQEKSMETMLPGMDEFESSQTEAAVDQDKENAHIGTLVSISKLSSVHSSSAVDQQTIDQSNFREMPDEEIPDVCSVIETESTEKDNGTELVRQDGSSPANYLVSEDIESSFTPDINTEKNIPEQNTEFGVEQAALSSPKDELSTNVEQKVHVNLSEVRGPRHSEDAVNEEKVEPKMPQMSQMESSSAEESESSLQTQQSEMNVPPMDSQPLDNFQSIKEQTHTGLSPTGGRRKLGSSRRKKGQLHDEHTTKMPLVMEAMRQEELKEQRDLDFKLTGEIRQTGSTVNQEENAEMSSQHVMDTSTTVTLDITSSSVKDNFVRSNKEVNNEENTLLAEPEKGSIQSPEVSVWRDDSDMQSILSLPSDVLEQVQNREAVFCDKENYIQQTNDTSETVGDVPIKDDNTGAESSMYVQASGQDENGVQSDDPPKKDHRAITHTELFPAAHNKTGPLALFDIGLEENIRAEPAVDVSEERGISSQEKNKLDDSESLQAGSSQKRRKMGSTRRIQLNRKPEEKGVKTEDLNSEAAMRNFDKMEFVQELPGSVTAEVSWDENAINLSLIPNTEDATNTDNGKSDEERPESVNATQNQALNAAEAPVVADLEIVKSVVRGGTGEEHMSVLVCTEEPDNANEGAHNKNLEMKNANLDSPNRRRKMGSTRRNLGLRTKHEDLHLKQEADNEATNVGDVKTEHFSDITEDELHLKEHNGIGSEQRKEKVFETVEYSHTGESQENPVSCGQLVETENLPTPKYFPAIPSTSPKHDLMSESAGRRRKMGSHRKSHGQQKYENQAAKEDRITDTQHVRDVRNTKDESAIKTSEELREGSVGLDAISEVDRCEEKLPSNISVSKEGEHSGTAGKKTPEPVQHLYPEVRLGQQQITLAGNPKAADLRSNAYNVMMVGDSSVGKTSFMKRAQSGKFSLDLPASVGLDSCMWTVVVEGKPVVLQLWDTAGQERFHSITRQIFHKAQAFLLMYDITSSQSFSAVSYWASCIQEGAAENVTVLLVGNKTDCAERQVKTQDAEILAKEHNFEFMECSAATGENVVQTLETVARMLSQKVHTREETMVLHKEPKQKKSSGCC